MKNYIVLAWCAVIIFLAGFFIIFLQLEQPLPTEDKIQLIISMQPTRVKRLQTTVKKPVIIKLRAENVSINESFGSEYFYRVVLNRAYDYSPGIVLKEFTKEMAKGEVFQIDIPYNGSYLESDSVKLMFHFNLYKRNGSAEPTLVSSATSLLYIED